MGSTSSAAQSCSCCLTEQTCCFDILKWLYDPSNIKGSLSDIIKKCKSYNIPNILICYKVIEYMIKINKTDEEIAEFFKDNNIQFSPDFLDQCIVNLKKLPIKPILPDRVFEEKANNFKHDMEHNRHIGFPVPNPQIGTVRLMYKYCAYEKCNTTFHTPDELKYHLKNANVFTPFVHISHTKLNLDDVLNETSHQPLNKCPAAFCCVPPNTLFTREQLIDHFKLFGKTQQDVEFIKQYNEKTLTEINLTKSYKDITSVPQCLICVSNVPQVIAFPCMHHIICLDCSQKQIKHCAFCRSPVEKFYPF
jgi:hypothetical protein